MPTIKTTCIAIKPFKPLEKILQDVLDTNPQKWNYFLERELLCDEILKELFCVIETKNFFTSDYSIEIFIDFLKFYIKEKCKEVQLEIMDKAHLIALNQIIRALQETIVHHTAPLYQSQQKIISHYLIFLRQLMENEHRKLFDKPEINLNSKDLQDLGKFLTDNNASINDEIIQQYISLLRISFDVPRLLAQYDVGLNINPLVQACFVNKNLDSHFITTKFFNLLGYQGQVLDYYKDDSRFNINPHLLSSATDSLKLKVIELQKYFFKNLNSQKDIDKALLQHYLYIYFFKVLYKKYPDQLAHLKTDPALLGYIKLDYSALPNSYDCAAYLPNDYKVIIEYKNLNDPQIACQAIACSSKSYKQWQAFLGLPFQKSNYIFRVGDNFEKYSFTYAYGKIPLAGGFYLSGEVKNTIVNGEAYSYFNDKHQFIEVSRHEAIHHDNFKLYLAARKYNVAIASFTNRNFNEGLAVLFAGGACAPGYISHDYSDTSAPRLEILFASEYIGYGNSWLYNNFFIQQYSHSGKNFFSDLLHLNQTVFENKWIPILKQDEPLFFKWLHFLNQTCQVAPKELSEKNCPSIYLKDYISHVTQFPISMSTRIATRQVTSPMVTKATTTKPNTLIEMPSKPGFYDDYLHLMHAIYHKNDTEINKTLTDTHYRVKDIVNYQDPERGLETPLHYLLHDPKNCSDSMIESLCRFGVLPNLPNKENQTAYMLAEHCDNWLKIKPIFDKQIQNLTKSTEKNETGLIPFQQKKLAITLSIPISSFFSGAIACGWEEIAQRNKDHYPYLPNLILYGLQPISLAIFSAGLNSLIVGNAAAIGIEDAWQSFAFYLGVNYFCLMLGQGIEKCTKKIQNKALNFLISILLYTLFLNPSLLITLVSEGFIAMNFKTVMMPLLSMLGNGLAFKLGEYGSKKVVKQFFAANATDSNNNQNYFLRYSSILPPPDVTSNPPEGKLENEAMFNTFHDTPRLDEKLQNQQIPIYANIKRY